MNKTTYLLALIATLAWTGVHADSHDQEMKEARSNLYLGLGAASLALDNDRVPDVPTSSPSHSSKIDSPILGYQFDELWAADLSFGTDLSNNVDMDAFALNGYRFLGTSAWRPYVSAGLSSFSSIEGHTEWIGTDEYNQSLSERRANAVKQKLVEDYGIDPERLDTRGYGESRPVADNETPAGRQQNRRAVAVIMQTRTVTE